MSRAASLVSVDEIESLQEKLESQLSVCVSQREQLRLRVTPLDTEFEQLLSRTELSIRDLKSTLRELSEEKKKLQRVRVEGRTPYRLIGVKEGKTVSSIELSNLVMGRQGDVVLDHASVSRQHVALLHGTYDDRRGWWIVDLGSAHGTGLQHPNEDHMTRLKPDVPNPLHLGSSFRLGKSSRVYWVTET